MSLDMLLFVGFYLLISHCPYIYHHAFSNSKQYTFYIADQGSVCTGAQDVLMCT